MTEEEKRSFYKPFGEVMKDTLERKFRLTIPIRYICIDCGEFKINYTSPPFEYLPHVRTHCWNCKNQTKHALDY